MRSRLGEKILAAADRLVTPRQGGPAPPGDGKPWTRRHPVLIRVILITGVLAVAVALAFALAAGQGTGSQ